jgi:hypothetical protein
MKKLMLLYVIVSACMQVSAADIRYSGMVGGGMFHYRDLAIDAEDELNIETDPAFSGVTSHGILIDDTYFAGASLLINEAPDIGKDIDPLTFYLDGEYRFLQGKTLRPFAGIQVYPVPGYVFSYFDSFGIDSYLRLRAGVRKTLRGNFHVLGEVSMSNSLGVVIGIGI